MVPYANALQALFLQRTEAVHDLQGAEAPRHQQDLVEQAIGAAKEKQLWLLAAKSVNLDTSADEMRTTHLQPGACTTVSEMHPS